MKEIAIYNKDHEIINVSLSEIASWRDSKIMTLTPYESNIDLIKLVDDYRNQAITIDVPVGHNLDEVINFLKKKHQEDMADYKINFNGVWLYSININEIDAYVAVTGMTREGCIKREQIERYRMQLHQEQEKVDAITNLDKRIEEGKKEIIQEKWSAWEEVVERLSCPPYYLHALDTIIKYLKLLNHQYLSVTEIASMFHEEFENETGDWYTSSILSFISRFSNRGTDMYRSAEYIAKNKGAKVANNKKYLKEIDDTNKLTTMGVPFEDAEELVKSDAYNIKIGNRLDLKLINIEDNLYEGISNTGKYAIAARIGNYYVTYLFNKDSYIRLLSNAFAEDTLISNNEEGAMKIRNAKIKSTKMRNILKNKFTIYTEVNKEKEAINIGLILQAFKEISDLAQEIETNYINSKVIDCIVNINKKKLTKTI